MARIDDQLAMRDMIAYRLHAAQYLVRAQRINPALNTIQAHDDFRWAADTRDYVVVYTTAGLGPFLQSIDAMLEKTQEMLLYGRN